MKIHELGHGIIYIEDAFPMAKDFIEAIEDTSKKNSVIPDWTSWVDTGHNGKVYIANRQGDLKQINWDYSINKQNIYWPRIEVSNNHSKDHQDAYETIKMIHEPLLETLEVWYKKTGNKRLEWISKNYTIKKYDTGKQIASHVDRVKENGHTFDWTVLVYLNDNYKGGDLYFDDLDLTISPSAGSIIFFSTDEMHTARQVTSGNKYFIFFYIHSEFGIMHSVKEKSHHIANVLAGDKN